MDDDWEMSEASLAKLSKLASGDVDDPSHGTSGSNSVPDLPDHVSNWSFGVQHADLSGLQNECGLPKPENGIDSSGQSGVSPPPAEPTSVVEGAADDWNSDEYFNQQYGEDGYLYFQNKNGEWFYQDLDGTICPWAAGDSSVVAAENSDVSEAAAQGASDEQPADKAQLTTSEQAVIKTELVEEAETVAAAPVVDSQISEHGEQQLAESAGGEPDTTDQEPTGIEKVEGESQDAATAAAAMWPDWSQFSTAVPPPFFGMPGVPFPFPFAGAPGFPNPFDPFSYGAYAYAGSGSAGYGYDPTASTQIYGPKNKGGKNKKNIKTEEIDLPTEAPANYEPLKPLGDLKDFVSDAEKPQEDNFGLPEPKKLVTKSLVKSQLKVFASLKSKQNINIKPPTGPAELHSKTETTPYGQVVESSNKEGPVFGTIAKSASEMVTPSGYKVEPASAEKTQVQGTDVQLTLPVAKLSEHLPYRNEPSREKERSKSRERSDVAMDSRGHKQDSYRAHHNGFEGERSSDRYRHSKRDDSAHRSRRSRSHSSAEDSPRRDKHRRRNEKHRSPSPDEHEKYKHHRRTSENYPLKEIKREREPSERKEREYSPTRPTEAEDMDIEQDQDRGVILVKRANSEDTTQLEWPMDIVLETKTAPAINYSCRPEFFDHFMQLKENKENAEIAAAAVQRKQQEQELEQRRKLLLQKAAEEEAHQIQLRKQQEEAEKEASRKERQRQRELEEEKQAAKRHEQLAAKRHEQLAAEESLARQAAEQALLKRQKREQKEAAAELEARKAKAQTNEFSSDSILSEANLHNLEGEDLERLRRDALVSLGKAQKIIEYLDQKSSKQLNVSVVDSSFSSEQLASPQQRLPSRSDKAVHREETSRKAQATEPSEESEEEDGEENVESESASEEQERKQRRKRKRALKKAKKLAKAKAKARKAKKQAKRAKKAKHVTSSEESESASNSDENQEEEMEKERRKARSKKQKKLASKSEQLKRRSSSKRSRKGRHQKEEEEDIPSLNEGEEGSADEEATTSKKHRKRSKKARKRKSSEHHSAAPHYTSESEQPKKRRKRSSSSSSSSADGDYETSTNRKAKKGKKGAEKEARAAESPDSSSSGSPPPETKRSGRKKKAAVHNCSEYSEEPPEQPMELVEPTIMDEQPIVAVTTDQQHIVIPHPPLKTVDGAKLKESPQKQQSAYVYEQPDISRQIELPETVDRHQYTSDYFSSKANKLMESVTQDKREEVVSDPQSKSKSSENLVAEYDELMNELFSPSEPRPGGSSGNKKGVKESKQQQPSAGASERVTVPSLSKAASDTVVNPPKQQIPGADAPERSGPPANEMSDSEFQRQRSLLAQLEEQAQGVPQAKTLVDELKKVLGLSDSSSALKAPRANTTGSFQPTVKDPTGSRKWNLDLQVPVEVPHSLADSPQKLRTKEKSSKGSSDIPTLPELRLPSYCYSSEQLQQTARSGQGESPPPPPPPPRRSANVEDPKHSTNSDSSSTGNAVGHQAVPQPQQYFVTVATYRPVVQAQQPPVYSAQGTGVPYGPAMPPISPESKVGSSMRRERRGKC